MNHKGQVLLEALGAGVLYWLCFFALIVFILFLWAQIWTQHCLYESLICLNSPTSTYRCKKIFETNSRLGLILFKAKDLKWNTQRSHIQVQIIGLLNLQRTVSKTLPKKDL